MELEYNGVKAELIDLTQYTRSAVYDPTGVDLIHIKHRIACVLVVGEVVQGQLKPLSTRASKLSTDAKQLIGYKTADKKYTPSLGDLNYAPTTYTQADSTHTDGTSASITQAEILTKLMVPRKQLKITAYTPRSTGSNDVETKKAAWIQAPYLTDDPCDADNGPKPVACDVIGVWGEGMLAAVEYVIEAATYPVAREAERAVLSHRWWVTHTEGQNRNLVRVTNGEVIFNPRLLRTLGQYADDFRSQFMHPIPLGFQRLMPQVTQSPSGDKITYVLNDIAPDVVFDPGDSGATTISIQEQYNYTNPFVNRQKLKELKNKGVGWLDDKLEKYAPGYGWLKGQL